MPGIASLDQLGLSTIAKDLLGTTLSISYGPTPGGGSLFRLFIGVPLGTRPAAGKASTFRNGP